MTATTPVKLCPQKLYQCYLLKEVYCMQNFIQFHAVESEIELSQEFWENRIAAPPTELHVSKLNHCYF